MFKPRIRLETEIRKLGHLSLDLGWFAGEPFKLFTLVLLSQWEYQEGFTVIELTVAKFSIHLSLY